MSEQNPVDEKVKFIRTIDYKCDICDEGILKPRGDRFQSGKETVYAHFCPVCSHVTMLPELYPKMSIVTVNGKEYSLSNKSN